MLLLQCPRRAEARSQWEGPTAWPRPQRQSSKCLPCASHQQPSSFRPPSLPTVELFPKQQNSQMDPKTVDLPRMGHISPQTMKMSISLLHSPSPPALGKGTPTLGERGSRNNGAQHQPAEHGKDLTASLLPEKTVMGVGVQRRRDINSCWFCWGWGEPRQGRNFPGWSCYLPSPTPPPSSELPKHVSHTRVVSDTALFGSFQFTSLRLAWA